MEIWSNEPAVRELGAHVLQVRVAHVVDGEDEEVVIFLDAFADVGEEPTGLLLVRLLGGLALVDDLCTLGDGHGDGVACVVGGLDRWLVQTARRGS